MTMTFDQFFETKEALSVSAAADRLGIDPTFFEDDDEVMVFEADCFITRQGDTYHAILDRSEYTGGELSMALRVYFDHYVWDCCDHTEAFLIDTYNEWLKWQDLPAVCALELQARDGLTPYQFEWLKHYCDVWDRVVG